MSSILPTAHAGLSGSGEVFFPVGAASFNGSTNYLNGTNAGTALSSKGTFSCWLLLNAGSDGNLVTLFVYAGSGSAKLNITKTAANKINVTLTDSTGALTYQYQTSNTYTSASGWIYISTSWNTNFSAGNKLSTLYINGASDLSVVADATNAFSIDYSVAGTTYIGATSVAQFLNGSLSEVYFKEGTYAPSSTLANLRKFFTASHRPAFLGTAGALPTGATASIYLSGYASSLATNKGGATTLTVNGPSLGVPTTTPSGNAPPTTNDRYWVGGSASWNGTATGKWAYYSNSASGAPEPTASNNVFFDANSGAVTVTIATTTAKCNNLNFTGFTGTFAGSTAIQISGSLTLGSGMTRTYTGAITFNAIAAGNTIASNGKTFASSITFNGIGGGWTFQDSFSTTGNFTISNGSVNTNNQSITSAAFTGTTGSLTLGTTTYTCTGSWSPSAGLTLSAASSTINITNNNITFDGANAYGTVALTNNSSSTASIIISGSNTFSTLTLQNNAGYSSFSVNASQTISTTLNLTGNNNSTQRLLIGGSPSTLTCNGSVNITNVDFNNITGAGSAAPFTGTSVGNAGGNSGITFTGAVTRFWVHPATASQTVFQSNWASSTGGATGASFPLPQDTANFDANSFGGAGKTVQMSFARFGAMNWTGATNSPTLNFNDSTGPTFYGSITLISGITVSGAHSFTIAGDTACTLTSGTKTFLGQLILNNTNTVTLGDAYTSSMSSSFTTGVILKQGTIDANGNNVTIGSFATNVPANTKTIKLGSGTWTLNNNEGLSTAWSIDSNTTVIPSTSTIKPTAATTTFNGNGATYSTLYYNHTGGTFTISGSNTFSTNLRFDANNTIKITGGTTQTLTGATPMTATGSSSNVITMQSTNTTNYNIVSANNITTDWISISRCQFSGGGVWHAGANSTDGGNNSGITFP